MALVSVKCRFCGLIDPVKKHCTGNGGNPHYRCQTCCRTFQLDYKYRACQPVIKEQVVELVINNAGIRETASALHISINEDIRTSPPQVTTLPLQNLKVHIFCGMDGMRSFVGNKKRQRWLCKEGFSVSAYGVQKLMAQLGLVVTQHIAYKVTTKRKHSDAVADDLLNQNFNPHAPNEVWAGDVTYLKTGEDWMYLAIVMDLYSRRIVGWHIDKRMMVDLVSKALMKAYNLRQPEKGIVFHSDKGAQYTSKYYRHLLTSYGIRASMGDVGAYWDNAVVERFFGS